MNWARFAFVLSDVLSIVLVIRLITLKLHDVYRVFCCFLLYEVFSESFIILVKISQLDHQLDYRLTWLILRSGSWVLYVWMVYALLRAILKSLPGILRLSTRVLNVVFPVSIVIAVISAGAEYVAAGTSHVPVRLDYLVSLGLILERLVATISLLTLLLMLSFVLWFPVRMPRNLAIFSIGFSIYFTAKIALLLYHTFWSPEALPVVDNGVTFILCACLSYWIIFLNSDGEARPVTIGHSWKSDKQSRLMSDLEAINAVLARSGRR